MSGYKGRRAGSALLAAACLVSVAGQAQAAAKWVAKGTGSNAYAETASRKPGSTLRFNCDETVTLHFYPPRAWDGATAFEIVVSIDGERIAIDPDATDRAIVLSDVPPTTVGTTEALRKRIKDGRSLVLSGPPTRRIDPEQLVFALEGAAEAITAFERRCPAARRAKSP